MLTLFQDETREHCSQMGQDLRPGSFLSYMRPKQFIHLTLHAHRGDPRGAAVKVHSTRSASRRPHSAWHGDVAIRAGYENLTWQGRVSFLATWDQTLLRVLP